jgi:hypothetical protein
VTDELCKYVYQLRERLATAAALAKMKQFPSKYNLEDWESLSYGEVPTESSSSADAGTTGAEGLDARLDEAKWWDENCGFPGRGAKLRADRIASLEAQRTATQRAPVTPPEGGIPKRLWEPICDANGVPLKCSICGFEIPRIDMGWHGDAEGKVVQHIECSYQQQIKELQAKLAVPAPVTTPGRDEALEEVRVMLEEQKAECLADQQHTNLNRMRADELDNALINLRALSGTNPEAAAAQRAPVTPPAPEPVIVGKMREFANECLSRYRMNPSYCSEIMHTEDTYKDILKLCALAAPAPVTTPGWDIRDALESAAQLCESHFANCDKTNVACHAIDAEAIRALAAAKEPRG